ncbi:hypothetical protein TRFO_05571 [Tritrichomonas foetus]|uniref:Uncharacterized protein n=1 Tax=Tritrichomonas foetus TaxID=1144522 RepID=A0A1J4K668_9EUKA|nr:hypothetical protein TRFO_05571 [Tritrichomonas foetus]|eukprot:OHT06376.1 hypothetical protein TRFO_05571 [Tritrichomonas foetus]
MPFADLTNHNETGFGHQEFHQQAQPQVLSRHVSRQDRYYDPPEKMFLPDPPRKYEGYRFEPSHDIWFEGEIELEPLPILREIQW